MVRRKPRTRTGYRKHNDVIWRYILDAQTGAVQERTKVRKRDEDYGHASRLVGDAADSDEQEEDLVPLQRTPEPEPPECGHRWEPGDLRSDWICGECGERADLVFNVGRLLDYDSDPEPCESPEAPNTTDLQFVEPRDSVFDETLKAMGIEDL